MCSWISNPVPYLGRRGMPEGPLLLDDSVSQNTIGPWIGDLELYSGLLAYAWRNGPNLVGDF
jgi:hypothetical protein